MLRAHPVDGFLHFAVAPVAAFDRVGRGGQQGIVQERECLFQSGAEELLKCLAHVLETLDSPAQAAQFFERRLRFTATVEEPVDLLHNRAERA